MHTKVLKISARLLLIALRSTGSQKSRFRTIVGVNFDGSIKPLLVVGCAYPSYDDGNFIAVLNPDAELLTAIKPGCGYNSAILKEIVRGKCDLMIMGCCVGGYKDRAPTIASKYKSRNPSPAKFPIR